MTAERTPQSSSHPSQIFLTRVLRASPWKNRTNTTLKIIAPWRWVRREEEGEHEVCSEIQDYMPYCGWIFQWHFNRGLSHEHIATTGPPQYPLKGRQPLLGNHTSHKPFRGREDKVNAKQDVLPPAKHDTKDKNVAIMVAHVNLVCEAGWTSTGESSSRAVGEDAAVPLLISHQSPETHTTYLFHLRHFQNPSPSRQHVVVSLPPSARPTGSVGVWSHQLELACMSLPPQRNPGPYKGCAAPQ